MFIINTVITAVDTVHTLYASTTIIGEHCHACASLDQHKVYITVVYASLLINHFYISTSNTLPHQGRSSKQYQTVKFCQLASLDCLYACWSNFTTCLQHGLQSIPQSTTAAKLRTASCYTIQDCFVCVELIVCE